MRKGPYITNSDTVVLGLMYMEMDLQQKGYGTYKNKC